MTKRFNPPAARRLSAVAIAAALAAFAGVVDAQQKAPPGRPGYVTNADGQISRSGQGACLRSGQWRPEYAVPECEGTSAASRQSAASGGTSAPRAARTAAPAAAAAPARRTAATQSAATGGTAGGTLPGYVTSADGRVVTNGFGQCVRAGHWTAANAAEPCDRVARAAYAPPPPVAQAPEPKAEPQKLAEPQPAPEPPRPVIQKLTLSTDVLFDFNSAQLKDAGKNRLDQLAAEVKDANVDEIVAVGHADRIASEEYNQKLSEARAQAVKDYLSQKVANANRLTAEGKGESQPVTGHDCDKMGPERSSNKKLVECLQRDRRVEIEVLGSRQVAGGATPAGAGTTASPASGSSTR